MKRQTLPLAAALMLAAIPASSRGDVYTDTTGDLGIDPSHTHLDITSVEVTNNFSDLIFKINLAGNPVAVDWGKYCIGFSTNSSTGDTSAFGNGWGRRITMGQGMDYWVGSWVDGGNGIQLWAYDGVGWSIIGGGSVSKTTNSVTLSIGFANLGKTFGDTVEFEVYTTGGGTDPAVDALSDPNITVTSWSQHYSNNLSSTYTIQTVGATTNLVTFLVDMGVPIWEFDTGVANGFDTNTDAVHVRGSFNGWGGLTSAYQLIQVGPTLFSNTVEVVATLGDTIQYKFYGNPFPEWESPALLGGGNRMLTITNVNMIAPAACFGDRCLTDPPTNNVNFEVDMGFQRQFGEFDPDAGDQVALPGNFNGWSTTANILTAGFGPNSNLYSGQLTYYYYPTGAMTVGHFKFRINSSVGSPRNTGWELPVNTSGGNRGFSLGSVNQVLSFIFNDENGVFPIDKIDRLDADSARLTFKAYAEGIYDIQSSGNVTGPWSSIGSVTNLSHTPSATMTFTNTGLTGVTQQFYRAVFTGFNKPPIP